MTERTLHIIRTTLMITGIVLFVGYGIFAIAYFQDFQPKKTCQNVQVKIMDSTEYRFVNEYEILHYINKHQLNPIGKVITIQTADSLENCLSKMNLAKQVECYASYNGDLCIQLWQRCPVFRVIDKYSNYYIDQDRTIMPTSKNFTAHLPVVSGEINQEFVTGELYNFITNLQEDEMWHSLLAEVHILPQQKIMLVFRQGVPYIYLGSLDKYKKKMARLKAWYEQYPQKNDPKIYSKINLAYEPLIYCTESHGKTTVYSRD